MEKSIMKLLLMMILMFGVAESRTALVLGTNYSTISSANDWEDDWEEDGIYLTGSAELIAHGKWFV